MTHGGRRISPVRDACAAKMLVGLALASAPALAGGCRPSPGEALEPPLVIGGKGYETGRFIRPRAIACAPDGSVYVADCPVRLDSVEAATRDLPVSAVNLMPARIQKFDADGRFLLAWSIAPFPAGKPAALAVADNGDLLVGETHHSRISRYSPSGKLLAQWGSYGREAGRFLLIRDLTTDRQGNIYAADYGYVEAVGLVSRIQKFTPEGKLLSSFGKHGSEPGELDRPEGVSLDEAGNIYVADGGNHRVQVFTDKGEYVSTIERQFYGPRAIAIDPQTNVVYVSDSGHHVVNVFDRSGKFIGIIGNRSQQPGDAEGEFKGPVGIDVGADGRVVVADTFNDRIQVFDRSGRFLRAWPVGFTMEGERGIEAHLAIAPDGRVFVTDPLGARVFVFGPDGEKLGVSDRAGTGEQFRVPMGITLSPDGCLLVSDLGWNKILKLPLP